MSGEFHTSGKFEPKGLIRQGRQIGGSVLI
jgi:hypothetical protein